MEESARESRAEVPTTGRRRTRLGAGLESGLFIERSGTRGNKTRLKKFKQPSGS